MYMRKIFEKRNELSQSLYIQELRFDEDYHFKYFRMSAKVFDCLLSKIEGLISHGPNHRLPISPKVRLAVTLRILATGETQQSSVFAYRIGKSTVNSIFHETCSAIVTALKSECLPTPDEQIWKSISDGFERKWNFPHCCGAIDGKHIRIRGVLQTVVVYISIIRNIFRLCC